MPSGSDRTSVAEAPDATVRGPTLETLGPEPFEPRQYLDHYFTDVDEEYEHLYRFWCGAIAALPPGQRALDLGAGPTLYSAFCLASRCSEIHLADYVPASLREIERWRSREEGRFDWSAHVRTVLRVEGLASTDEAVAAREAALRRSITGLLHCDLCAPTPLAAPVEPYDVVTAHYCVEMATATTAAWAEALRRVCALLRPGGTLLLSTALEMRLLRVFAPDEPARLAARVTLDDARDALSVAGIDLSRTRITTLPAPHGRPYAATLLVAGPRMG